MLSISICFDFRRLAYVFTLKKHMFVLVEQVFCYILNTVRTTKVGAKLFRAYFCFM